jgi:hypothetical protein
MAKDTALLWEPSPDDDKAAAVPVQVRLFSMRPAIAIATKSASIAVPTAAVRLAS